ncbi:MAG: FliM/FliN family flagellar motor switch protein [Planctomycetaceae bacterium]|nr:FliM/FliN family flagellar motor switch protein [Planctomycetaceae bacterium]
MHALPIDATSAESSARSPRFARSILRIKVPVAVTLASGRHKVGRILEFAPGTLLQFNTACDEPLTLSVAGCDIAVGEAVTVGERLGLRITSVVHWARRA